MNTNTFRHQLMSAFRFFLMCLPFLYGQVQAQTTQSFDGIYSWSTDHYLSLHQDGTTLIATIYFNSNGNYTFKESGVTFPVPTLDLFDLMSGPITGSTAHLDGTRFHRQCNVAYDFKLNTNATITVTRTNVSNNPAATSAGISCSAYVGGMEAATMNVPKLRFNTKPDPVGLAALFGHVTFRYQYSSIGTIWTDVVDFTQENIDASSGSLVNTVSGDANRTIVCAVVKAEDNSYSCVIADLSFAATDAFKFNLNSGQINNGQSLYCDGITSSAISTCVQNLFTSPDGTVWGSVSK